MPRTKDAIITTADLQAVEAERIEAFSRYAKTGSAADRARWMALLIKAKELRAKQANQWVKAVSDLCVARKMTEGPVFNQAVRAALALQRGDIEGARHFATLVSRFFTGGPPS